MPIFKYQPYYTYSGPTLSQPFREELSAEQVQHHMDLFFRDIGHYFADVSATIEQVGNGFVAITAEIAQSECDERVKRCLNDLDLFAKKVAAQ